MRIPRIYTAQSLQTGHQIELEPGAALHISKVLRMAPGRELTLFNGQGGEYLGTVTDCQKKRVAVELTQWFEDDKQSPLAIELGIAISKGDRMDTVFQKATELGATRIRPLFSERVEVKLAGERLSKKLKHWQQVTIAACEQCGRNRLPEITPPQHLNQWLDQADAQCKLVLHHRSESSLNAITKPDSIALLVGPEGGLSADEIAAAERAGFTSMVFGPRILRTETAPLAAISVLQYLWGDF